MAASCHLICVPAEMLSEPHMHEKGLCVMVALDVSAEQNLKSGICLVQQMPMAHWGTGSPCPPGRCWTSAC